MFSFLLHIKNILHHLLLSAHEKVVAGPAAAAVSGCHGLNLRVLVPVALLCTLWALHES